MTRVFKVILIILTLSIFSCQKNYNSTNDFGDAYKVELKDSLIVRAIKDYTQENRLDKRKSYILIRVESGEGKELIYIEQGLSYLGEYSTVPSFYTVIDDFLVLIHTKVDFYLNKPKVLAEVNNYIENSNITLDRKIGHIYDPPVWVLQRCAGDIEYFKDNWPRNRLRSIPCGYELIRDSVQFDSLFIHPIGPLDR